MSRSSVSYKALRARESDLRGIVNLFASLACAADLDGDEQTRADLETAGQLLETARSVVARVAHRLESAARAEADR